MCNQLDRLMHNLIGKEDILACRKEHTLLLRALDISV